MVDIGETPPVLQGCNCSTFGGTQTFAVAIREVECCCEWWWEDVEGDGWRAAAAAAATATWASECKGDSDWKNKKSLSLKVGRWEK